MASAALTMPGPSAATNASARSSLGTARKTSVMRMKIVSTQPPTVARHGADDEADRRRGDDDERDDQQRQPRAVDEARVDVAAELVGAEPEFGARAPRAASPRLRQIGIVRREQRREGGARRSASRTMNRPSTPSGLRSEAAAEHLEFGDPCGAQRPARIFDGIGDRHSLAWLPRARIERAVEHVAQHVEEDVDGADEQGAAEHGVHVARRTANGRCSCRCPATKRWSRPAPSPRAARHSSAR